MHVHVCWVIEAWFSEMIVRIEWIRNLHVVLEASAKAAVRKLVGIISPKEFVSITDFRSP